MQSTKGDLMPEPTKSPSLAEKGGRLKQLLSIRSLEPAPQLATPAESGSGAEQG